MSDDASGCCRDWSEDKLAALGIEPPAPDTPPCPGCPVVR